MGAGAVCARFTALLLLTAAFILGFLCTLSEPSTSSFSFVTATFYTPNTDDPNAQVELRLKLGMWGYCVYPTNGTKNCPHSAVGYSINQSLLPPETNPPPYEPLNQIMNYKLVGAMMLVVLQVGQTSLVILAALIPNRIFSLMALILCGLAVGLAGLNLLISFITFVGAADRIQAWWVGVALADQGPGQWMLLTSIFLLIAAVPFLWAAVPPPRQKKQAAFNMSQKGASR